MRYSLSLNPLWRPLRIRTSACRAFQTLHLPLRPRYLPSPWKSNFSERYCGLRNSYRLLSSTADDTIYALSTAPGRAAIAVIRISGPACLQIYKSLCPDKPNPKPRAATLRKLSSPSDQGRVLDTAALLLYFPHPNTVTGEDVLELHVHGGPAIVRSVLDAIPSCTDRSERLGSVRAAEAGEFTKRAFYNGRIDLTEVEALGEALAAETEQQRRLAVSGAAGSLTYRYEEWRSMLLYARGELEALIDFSEDQHFDESPVEFMASVTKQVLDLKKQLKFHILNSSRGELLRNGINVALLGAPNAGKSSLLNRIVGREAAIVSAEEGTTRDIVDVSIDLQGWLVRLGDMAGVRADLPLLNSPSTAFENTKVRQHLLIGEIEREGIRRARERALQADLVIALISIQLSSDGVAELAVNDELVAAIHECQLAEKNLVFALNKIDLLHVQRNDKKVSISSLLSKLIEIFPSADPNNIFCLSCLDADKTDVEEPDAGGLQNFMSGLTANFANMTRAAAGLDLSTSASMTSAEAQTYWTASLNVSHRQKQYLQECLDHLVLFLEISDPGPVSKTSTESPQKPRKHEALNTTKVDGFFDTLDKTPNFLPGGSDDYHTDGHEDIVGTKQDGVQQHTSPCPAAKQEAMASIPYSWAADPTVSADSMPNDEIDIVTAAEHLRHAADCLAKLTGRSDGVTSGADVEDVLGIVFEKFCVGK